MKTVPYANGNDFYNLNQFFFAPGQPDVNLFRKKKKNIAVFMRVRKFTLLFNEHKFMLYFTCIFCAVLLMSLRRPLPYSAAVSPGGTYNIELGKCLFFP